jgi:hypothetical protein
MRGRGCTEMFRLSVWLVCVALAVATLIGLESRVRSLSRSVLRCRSLVAMLRIKVVVHVAVKALRRVRPVAGTDKVTAVEPLGAIVAIGSAVIWRIVVVAIRAAWLRSEVDANGNLRVGLGCGNRKSKQCRRR